MRPGGKFALLDLSQPPQAYRDGTGFNRAYLAQMLLESGSTELLVYRRRPLTIRPGMPRRTPPPLWECDH